MAGRAVLHRDAERYLEAFDAIRVDCLNGDKYKTGKTTPDGRPDPSIFSTPGDPVGIQVGTAIATLVRKSEHAPAESVGFRHLWGQAKLTELTDTAESEPAALYCDIEPVLPLGLPFAEVAVNRGWSEWPSLPDLFPTSFPGVKTSRDSFLIDVDLDRLEKRVADYFNHDFTHEEIARLYPSVMNPAARYDPRAVRDSLLKRDEPDEKTGIIRYAYRPLDNRWLYWEAETKLLDEKRADYKPHVFDGNLCLVFQRKARPDSSPPLIISKMGDLNQMNSGVYCVLAYLRERGVGAGRRRGAQRVPTCRRRRNATWTGWGWEWRTCSTTRWRCCTTRPTARPTPGRCGWSGRASRCPAGPTATRPTLPGSCGPPPHRGRELAALLDPETPVAGVTAGALRPELAAIAVPSTADGRNMTGDDFALTAGWGHFGTGDAVMPGQGRAVERDYTAERGALGRCRCRYSAMLLWWMCT